MAKTVQKWAESVPENFGFTFKLWKEITHNKKQAFKAEDLCQIMETIGRAGNKKGSLIVQFCDKRA